MTRVDFKLSLNTDQNENYIQFSHKGEYYRVTEVLLGACSQNESGGIYIPHARHRLTIKDCYEAPNYGSVRREFS